MADDVKTIQYTVVSEEIGCLTNQHKELLPQWIKNTVYVVKEDITFAYCVPKWSCK